MSTRTPAQLWELLVAVHTDGLWTIEELAAEYPTFAARTLAQESAPPLALRQLADAVAEATYEDVAISAQAASERAALIKSHCTWTFAAKTAPAEEYRDYRDPPAWPCWPSAPEVAPEPEAAADVCDRIADILLGPGGLTHPPGWIPRHIRAEAERLAELLMAQLPLSPRWRADLGDNGYTDHDDDREEAAAVVLDELNRLGDLDPGPDDGGPVLLVSWATPWQPDTHQPTKEES